MLDHSTIQRTVSGDSWTELLDRLEDASLFAVCHAFFVGFCFSIQSTYDYGKQFLQASLVLRRTCRYELSPNYEMEEKLNKAWGEFSSAMAERGARLSVALMFHRSAEKVIKRRDNDDD